MPDTAPGPRLHVTRDGLAIAFLVASIVAFAVVRVVLDFREFDLRVYRVEGQAIRSGWDLYGPLPTPLGSRDTYPPFAALLFVPLTLVSVPVMGDAVFALNIGLLLVVSMLSCRLVGLDLRRHRAAVLVIAGVALWSEPVFTTLRYGQINLLVLALVLADFSGVIPVRLRGIGIGLAAGIKVTPLIFIAYLILTRRFRFAAQVVATTAATAAVSALVVPHAVVQYWTKSLFSSTRVGRIENAVNQSVRGVLVRIDHSRDTSRAELLLIGVVLIAGLLCAAFAYHRLGEAWGVAACAVTGLLVPPIAWSHHWVWCVPIAVLLWREAPRWLVAALVFWSFAVWAIPHTNGAELSLSPVQIALSGWYVFFGLLFLALTAARGYAHRRPTTKAAPVS